MRSRLAWLLGLAGLLAFLRRRRAQRPAVDPGPDARARELRRVLDESRREEPEAPGPAAEPPAPPAESPAERRRKVHEAGRAAVEEMRGSSSAD